MEWGRGLRRFPSVNLPCVRQLGEARLQLAPPQGRPDLDLNPHWLLDFCEPQFPQL